MENNLQIGVVLKKKENIYTPEKTIYGYFKEEEKKFVDEDNTQYDIISSKKDNAVAFVFDVEVLLKLYNTDKENLPIIFFKDISNYLIVENEDDIKYIFKGEAPEILEPNEFANHFVSLVNGKNAEYFNLDKLVSTVFEEAIFEILTSDEQFTNLSVNKRVLKNNRNYNLR